jgi:hypothetical protein
MTVPDTLELQPINPNPRPKKPGTYGRGNPPPGKGRVPGSANRIGRDLKIAVLTAAANVGRSGSGKGGLVGYLEFLAGRHPKAYAGLLGRVLPLQINADVNNAVIGAINVVSIPCDRFLSATDAEKLRQPLTEAQIVEEGSDDEEKSDDAA